MIRTFLKSGFRFLKKNRVYASINILGLTIALTASFFILQYVAFERSFDDYHSQKDRIYRIGTNMMSGDNMTQSAGSFFLAGKQASLDYSQIEDYFTTTMNNAESGFIADERSGSVKSFRLNKVFYSTPSILNILDLNFLQGNPDSGLEGTRNIVLTESVAKRIFGSENPLGKTLQWFDNSSNSVGSTSFQVGAVVSDIPENSSFQFELLFPMKAFEVRVPALSQNGWRWSGFFNYLLLKEGINKEFFEEASTDFLTRHAVSQNQRAANSTYTLEPITKIHLESKRDSQPENSGDITTVNILSIVALLLIALAYTNYFNLNTSMSINRCKEVAIRKIVGSHKSSIIFQFLVESIVINFIAFSLTLLVIFLIGNSVSNWIQGFPDLYLSKETSFWVAAIVSILSLSILSGIYPALMISGQNNLKMLKGKFAKSPTGGLLQKSMVVIQFLVSSVLILFTIVLNQQINYMLNQDIGANVDQVLVVRSPFIMQGDYVQTIESFRDRLVSNPNVSAVSASTMIPGVTTWGNGLKLLSSSEQSQYVNRIEVDEYYVDVFNHKIIAGRSFSPDFLNDENGIMVNEAVCDLIGISPEELIGQTVLTTFDTLTVVGVFEDYYHYSLKQDVVPITFVKAQNDFYYLSIRLNNNTSETLSSIETLWEEKFPGSPFDYFFANDRFCELYAVEKDLSNVIKFFSGIALFIACMGLFGLSMFILINKRKEVSVRKVLGAKANQLFWTLSKEIIMLIGLSSIVAIPLAYYAISNWLESFSIRTDIHTLVYFIPLIFSLVLTIFTISYNVIKTIKINPAVTLRSE